VRLARTDQLDASEDSVNSYGSQPATAGLHDMEEPAGKKQHEITSMCSGV